jgi:subtilisin family serine protease
MTRWLPRVALVAMLAILASTAFAESSKLDIAARIAIYNLQQGVELNQMREGGVMAATDEGEIDCFIVGDVTRAELEAAGARIRTALPGIFTAFIPLANVDAVAALAGVERIEGAQIEEVEHDVSIATTNATLFRGAGPTFTGLNGAGVIVGNIDTGVDYDHQDFKDAGGLTRFLKIWDQTDPIGPAALGFGYGSDWTAADINALTSRAKDTHGHGSHTMGTIGGDGSQTAGGSAPAFTYTGMAPMADLIAVDGSTSGSFSNTSMIDGISYIFQQATLFGKPAVANLSIGGSFGPHDGSSTFEVAVDLMTGPGRSVVFSSGNSRGDPQHAEINATGPGAIVTMSCLNGAVLNRRFQINGWYNSTETVNVTVTTPNGTVIGPIALGGMNAAYPGTVTANGAVYVENGVTTSTNGSPMVIIDVINQNAVTQNLTGTWTYTFTALALGAANGEVDLWRNFQSNAALAANFVIGNNSTEELVNAIGTGLNVITVASWTSKRFWTDCDGQVNINFNGAVNPGPISPFSSMGPTRDNRNKPELCAPGSAIASVLSQDFASVCPVGATTLLPGLVHTMNQGTSMAAPHVTGAIGLLFQKYGYMSVADVRNFLQTRALVDGFTGAVWNKDYGYGKLYLGDLSDPLCTVTSPNGGEVIPVGSNINLTWNASDAYLGVTGVDLELSRTGVGGPYTAIATGAPNTGSFAWVVTGPTTNNAILRVTAKDAAGNAGVDVSDLEWAIVDPPVATTVAVFRAEPTLEGVRLVWQFNDPSQFSRVVVERAMTGQGPWSELDAELSTEGENTVALDRTAQSGLTYYYRLAAIYASGGSATFGPLTATGGESITEFALKGVAPNPTAGPALIEYAVPRASDVSVVMFDLQGREVATLASGSHAVGRYQVTWSGEVDGGPARAGIYFLRMKAPGFSQTRRVVVSY